MLTPEQKSAILKMHKSNFSTREIAQAVQCAHSTVIRNLQKFKAASQVSRYSIKFEGQMLSSFELNNDLENQNSFGLSELNFKIPTNELLNYYPQPIAQYSYTKMMEVKHSPSSQMDFRTARNGLPIEKDDEDMKTLLDTNIVKSIPTSSLECDSTPILNGKAKHPPLEDGMEIDLLDDDMDEELNSTSDCESKQENEETEVKKEEELLELDLEEAVVKEEKVTNGEITDSTSVRDTGDDLDTLLSKINDLVEDCMEPSTEVGSVTETTQEVEDDVVELIDDENENVSNDKEAEPEKDANECPNKKPEECIAESAEESEIKKVEVEEKVPLEAKEEDNIELEASEGTTDDVSEVKSIVDLSEDVPEEIGMEMTEEDLELAEEDIQEEKAVIQTPTETAEEISEEEAPEISEESATITEKEELLEEPEEPAREDTSETLKEAESEIIQEVLKEEEKVSEQTINENMDIDDDIVCLDSPVPEEKEEDKDLVSEESNEKTLVSSSPQGKEEQMQTEEKEVPQDDKPLAEEAPAKKLIPDEPKTNEIEPSKSMVEDDEIFLIEDDDDEDVPMKEVDFPLKQKDNEIVEKSTTPEDKSSKETMENIPKTVEALSAQEKPEEKKDEDDEIVCLDDSFEEIEEKVQEKKPEEQKQIEPNSKSDGDAPVETPKEGNVSEEQVKDKTEMESVEQLSENKEKDVEMEVGTVVPGVKTKESAEKDAETEKRTEYSEKILELPEKINKSTEQVVQEAFNTILQTENKETAPAASEPEKSLQILNDNEIINLDDDDEDETAPSTEQSTEKTVTEVSTNKASALLSDNSDNARDGAEEKEDKNEIKVSEEKSTPMVSETNSNSSSNLLKESAVTGREESLIEQSEQPPAKRIRLSQGEEANTRNSNASQDDTSSKLLDDDEIMEVAVTEDEESKTLKRVHSTESISSDFKKPKTDVEPTKIEEKMELLEEIIPPKNEVKAEEKDEKKSVDVKPLPLYPPPKFDGPKIGLSLDFLRRFKKSIHKMNKSDLEELVLQKIVEAIVHKSEFSEMRELIEKQEKIITGHRTKITELNKQFRDLEMVHNRVLKDLETKNSQFIMPVKITRAVGLQVFFPNKKCDQPMSALAAANQAQVPASSSLSRSVSTSSSTSSSISEKPPASNPATMNNQVPQTQVPVTTVGINNQPRRGCVQKLTPMRPDGPRHAMPNRPVTAAVVSSSTPSPITPINATPKILNRQVAPKPRLPQSPVTANIVNSNIPQQVVNTLLNAAPLEPKTPPLTQSIACKKTGGVVKTFPQSKRIPKSWQADQPAPAQTSAMPAPSASVPPLAQLSSPANTPVATKTPNKSVIDLTDEDDVTPAPSPRTPNVQATVQKTPINTPPHRVGPYKVSVIPAAQLQQQPRPNPPKPAPPRPPNAPQITAKPNGAAQNTVVRSLPVQKYHHPAPLPNQPIHSSNPLWKLPPARPTIRISNLDSGIVISWTIEDTAKERYAESTSYQIYAYQETSGPPLVESWRHVGDVKAMLLPMAVTLTQFQEGQRYYFAVRAVDAHNRCGPFSFAKTWS